MSTQASIAPSSPSKTQLRLVTVQVLFQLLVLGALVLFLMNYKGTSGVQKIRQTRASGRLVLPSLQQGGASWASDVIRDTGGYLRIVWPALVFGVLISAAVRTSLSRTPLKGIFGRGPVRDQITGALAGMPLMLCSCCAAPIFPSVYEKTRRIGPALAVALAAPSLNPVALTLSFILFPWRVAGGRLLMAAVLVLIGSACVAALARDSKLPTILGSSEPETKWRDLFRSYLNSLIYVGLRTVPLIVIGVTVSMWIMRRFPLNALGASAGGHALVTITIALIAVLLTLPSLFEIPLALSIIAVGAPLGAAAAVLFAGPAINIPSLLVIARHSNWKVGVALAGFVWALAAAGGLLIR